MTSITLLHPKSSEYLYRKYHLGKRKNSEFFEGHSTEESIRKEIATGDILLFRRRLSWLKPYRSLLCLLSRKSLQGSYDHIAVIIFDENKKEPYVLECGLSGLRYTPFEERISSSLSKDIVLRLLTTKKLDPAKLYALKDFVASELEKRDKGNSDFKKDTLTRLLYSSPRNLDPNYFVYNTFCVVNTEQKLQMLRRESIIKDKENKEYFQAFEEAELKLREHKEKISELSKLYRKSDLGYSNVEMVVNVYQILGLLPKFPTGECYGIDSFADVPITTYAQLKYASLPLLDGAELGTVVHFRRIK